MAPESLNEAQLELRTQFEDGIEVPRPLRIIKRSGTYTAEDGSVGLRPGALVIPRRVSSRTISTSTSGTQQEGPFGCLTIHKKRGSDIRSVLRGRSSPAVYQIGNERPEIDQLMEELLRGVCSRSLDWVEGRQGPDFHGQNGAQSATFLPPHQFAKLPTFTDPQILSFIKTQDLPLSSSSFSPSPDAIKLAKNTSLKRSLLRFPKFSNTSRKGQPVKNSSALRDLVNIPHLKTSSQDHFETQPSLPSKENTRRSSRVTSITGLLRKISTSGPRNSSSRHHNPPAINLFDKTTTDPNSSQEVIMQEISRTEGAAPKAVDSEVLALKREIEHLRAKHVAEAIEAQGVVLALQNQLEHLNFLYSNQLHAPTILGVSVGHPMGSEPVVSDEHSTQNVLFVIAPTYQVNEGPCHDDHTRQQCTFPGGDRLLSKITCILDFNPVICHAHMGTTASDQRPRQPATDDEITLRPKSNSNRWILELENVRHGDAVYVNASVTFYPTSRETTLSRWLNATISWEHPEFPHGDTTIVSRRTFAVRRFRRYNLLSPPPHPRSVVPIPLLSRPHPEVQGDGSTPPEGVEEGEKRQEKDEKGGEEEEEECEECERGGNGDEVSGKCVF